MNEVTQSTSRRTVLQRCLLFVAGAMGLPSVANAVPSRPDVSPPGPKPAERASQTVRFYARALQTHCPGRKPGELPTSSGRMHSRADLLDKPGGAKVGEFCATCLGPDSHFGIACADQSVELQTLNSKEGTLFGIGSAESSAAGAREHAILGGTGRFAGARGSYVIRQASATAGRASVEFVITLIS